MSAKRISKKIGRPVKEPGAVSTKERIRDAAINLFAEKGYEGVSIRDIARAVDIVESSVYKHYDGKDSIMDEIFEYFKSKISTPVPVAMPDRELLEKYGAEGFINMTCMALLERIEDPGIRKVWRLVSLDLYRNPKIREFFKATIMDFPLQFWERIFRQMMDLGHIKEYDARQLAVEFTNYFTCLYFDLFVIHYDETTDPASAVKRRNDLSGHIRFILDAVRIDKAQ